MATETGWRKCIKCAELFFSGSVQGACSAGGSHDAGDSTNPKFIGMIAPIEENTNLSDVQTMPGFRRCQYCQCMFFANVTASGIPLSPVPFKLGGGAPPPVCPAAGGHGKHSGSGSAPYLLATGVPANDAAAKWLRGNWQHCSKCSAVFQAGSTASRCVSDGKPHTGAGSFLLVCTERLARLPLPSKAAAGKDVNFKADTNSVLGWIVASQCTWTSATETRLSAQSKWGEGIAVNLDFEMVDNLQCAVRVSMGGEKKFEVLGIDAKDVDVPPITLNQTVPCSDQDGTSNPDVEFAPGRNNAQVLSLFAVGTMYPKNDNRVRLSLLQPIGGFQNFELETQ